MQDTGFNLPVGNLTFHVVDRPPLFHLAAVLPQGQGKLDSLHLTPQEVPGLARLLCAGKGELVTPRGGLRLEPHYGDIRLSFTGRAADDGALSLHVVDQGSLVALSHLIWATVAVGSHALLTEALLHEFVWGDWNFGSDVNTTYLATVLMDTKGMATPERRREQRELLRADLVRRVTGTPWAYLLPTLQDALTKTLAPLQDAH